MASSACHLWRSREAISLYFIIIVHDVQKLNRPNIGHYPWVGSPYTLWPKQPNQYPTHNRIMAITSGQIVVLLVDYPCGRSWYFCSPTSKDGIASRRVVHTRSVAGHAELRVTTAHLLCHHRHSRKPTINSLLKIVCSRGNKPALLLKTLIS